jgi:hypothetical protein
MKSLKFLSAIFMMPVIFTTISSAYARDRGCILNPVILPSFASFTGYKITSVTGCVIATNIHFSAMNFYSE